MLINFFMTLRKYKVPVTIRELLDLLTGLKMQLVYANIDDFYLFSRTAMVKDEKDYDKFDRAFSAYFKGLDDLHGLLESLIPDEWLRREFEKSLSAEDLEQIEGLGGWHVHQVAVFQLAFHIPVQGHPRFIEPADMAIEFLVLVVGDVLFLAGPDGGTCIKLVFPLFCGKHNGHGNMIRISANYVPNPCVLYKIFFFLF